MAAQKRGELSKAERLGNPKKQTHHVLGRISLIVEQDKEHLVLGTGQTTLGARARTPHPGLARRRLRSSHGLPFRSKEPSQLIELARRQAGGCPHQPIRPFGMIQRNHPVCLPRKRPYYQSPLLLLPGKETFELGFWNSTQQAHVESAIWHIHLQLNPFIEVPTSRRSAVGCPRRKPAKSH
jgi:hypothetical protein